MKLQARNFVVRKPETIDITMFFKKFCIATRTNEEAPSLSLELLRLFTVKAARIYPCFGCPCRLFDNSIFSAYSVRRQLHPTE